MKSSRSPLRAWARKYGIGACFYMPFFLLFCLFTIIPVFVSMFMSLTDYDMLGHAGFIGLDNYANLFLHDGNFLLALKNTFLIGGVSGVIGYLASFLFAWVINNMKLKKLYTVLFYMPSIAGGMGVIWDYLFSGDRYGLINNALIRVGLLNQPIVWNQNAGWIIPINMLIIIWGSMGTGFLVFLAGLQNEDKQLIEAGHYSAADEAAAAVRRDQQHCRRTRRVPLLRRLSQSELCGAYPVRPYPGLRLSAV